VQKVRTKLTYQKLFWLLGVFLLLQIGCPLNKIYAQQSDSTGGYQLRYPLENKNNFPFSTSGFVSPLLIPPPSNVEQKVVYDPETNSYVFSEKIGSLNYRPPVTMSFNQYQSYQQSQAKSDYWRARSREEAGAGPSFMKNLRLGNQSIDRVFGSEGITITPQGSAELIFGYSWTTNRNPMIPVRNQRNGSFIFKEKIQMNVTGAIGDKMEVGLNYNTEASFDFENKTKLEYSGKEDEIIKRIQAGDVSFPLPGTLINGKQSLFGIYTELQFGRLTVSTVLSNQRSESSSVNVQGGAQQTEYEIDIDKYDVNRHFFLSHFFRDNYNKWLENPQKIESQIKIESIEVWVVNRQSNFEQSRNIVGIMDLAEGYGPDGAPNFLADENLIVPTSGKNLPADNDLNRMYSNISANDLIRDFSSVDAVFAGASSASYTFYPGIDYVSLRNARPLSSREFTVNNELGYISLNSPLRNDEILAVAYVYTYKGETKKVGELSGDREAPQNLIVKLLKGTTQTPNLPNWDLMMKNVYSIGAFQVSRENFILNVLYRNDKTGVSTNVIKESGDNPAISDEVDGEILLKVVELDNLDGRNEPFPDGQFDFVEGVTINSRNGRIKFPLIEPFGKDLRDKIIGDTTFLSSDEIAARHRTADKYVYEELYDSTQTKAQQVAEKNKFYLRGHYQGGGSSDIMLNAMNIPPGSVSVTAGGVVLTENVDYTVDYTLGRVKILNQGLVESGTPIKVNLESNSFFNIQQKTLLGTHLDYRFSENFNLGGTIMRLNERPLTEKVNVGEEPISNTIWGLNTSYRTESQFLTTLVDKIPFLETKEPSSIALDAEFAQLIPGQSKIIGSNGVAYIDDFEGAQTKIELKSFHSWTMASPPQSAGSFSDFLGGDLTGIESGYGRSKLSWYVIDPVFYGDGGNRPSIPDEALNDHRQREILTQEIFPNKDDDIAGFNSRISVLNLNFYPNERGPYNYDTDYLPEGNPVNDMEERWGGIMREIITTDFEASNIEYLEFWLMDPFLETPDQKGGELYIHLGEISEDILKDNETAYENGFPIGPEKENVKESIWGYVPTGNPTVNAFDNDPESRKYQDIGLDGLSDEEEEIKHPTFASVIDPSADNFEYFLSSDHDAAVNDILTRYKNYNGLENNSPVATDNNEIVASNRPTPDVEDINDDNTLNIVETYYQYRVDLESNSFVTGKNYIVDEVVRTIPNNPVPAKWYQFRIPVNEFERKVGAISDFKSIRFLRLMLKGFDEPVVLRFATLELVRGEWRRYNSDMQSAIPSINDQNDPIGFEVGSVNIEENADKTPVNYVLPPGITRVTDPNQPQVRQLNEQSLQVKVTDLQENDGRAVYKNTQLDLRQYKKLEMFIHAEALPEQEMELNDYDITAFIRIGSDYQNNYYEYEIPLKITPPGTYDEISADTVWQTASNSLLLEVQKFVDLKVERNNALENDGALVSAQTVYIKQDGKNRIKVKGNPNLSNIRQIMMGVRNPGDEYEGIPNDGLEKSAELWFNELRLTDFNNDGGWAANGRVQAKLSDFGILNVAGATSKAGFGSIEQKTEERQREEINQVDVSSNLELGKFFPEKASVSIPFYVGYSNSTINPEYYPKDPDRKLEDVLDEAETAAERRDIKRVSQDKMERTSLNVTNVRWNKQFNKVKILQPSNLSASVLYTQTKASNYSIDYNKMRKYGASLNYVYSNRTKPVTPFKKSKALRKPAYRIIRDFNFNYMPSSFTFGTKFDRNYQSMKIRNVYDDVELVIEPTTSKDLYWDRNYTLRWDFTRALKFDYSATNNAIIDEPYLDPYGEDYREADLFEGNNEYWKQEVRNNIINGGRTLQFNQQFNLSYTLPLNKIPILNWTNIKASYNGTYTWIHGPRLVGRADLGHTLKNGNTTSVKASFNMKNLYNKVGYFKQLDRKYSGRGKSQQEKRYKTVEFTKRTFVNKDKPKSINHKLGTEDVTVRVTDNQGNEVQVKMEIINDNKITIEADKDLTGINVFVEGKIERGENPLVFIGENTVRFLLGVKNISISQTNNASTMLGGYLPQTTYLGFDGGDIYNGAPGWPFILGMQDYDINRTFSERDWLTEDSTFTSPTMWGVSESFNYRMTFEPFKGFRIDLSGLRSHSKTLEQKYINYWTNTGDFDFRHIDNTYQGGNFKRSIVTIGTAFETVSTRNQWESAAFNQLKENRGVISQRLSYRTTSQDPNYSPILERDIEPGYGDGYSASSSEVLIYSFLSAYTNEDPSRIRLEPFSWVVMPNWKITFDGLSKVKAIQAVLKTLTITHSYKSTYSIGQYSTNVEFFDNESLGDQTRQIFRDAQNDFIPQYRINTVSINEQISPLIGFDMTWHNSLLTRFEVKRARLLALSLNNQQLTESRNVDYVFGAGFKFKNVPLRISTAGGGQTQIKSDLNVRFDLTLRDNVTILRYVNETSADQATTGARKFVMGLTADYVLSQRVNTQFYIDWNKNTPFVSTNFPNSEFAFGFSLRLSL
jgi:cell surface protein SprA